MREIPASNSILPTYVKDALAGDLLETHRLALRSLDLLAELRARVNEIKSYGSRNLITHERFLAATIELHEISDTYTSVEVYEHVACELIDTSRSKEIKYEEHLGECFHELVLRMVGMNLSALFMLLFPLHWKSDREALMDWLAVDASHEFESEKFRFGVGGKDAWWLQVELRREALGAATLLERDQLPKPSWNRELAKLSYDGCEIKSVRSISVAKNVVKILDAFQEEDWPTRIDDPLAPPDQQRMHETIRRLNDKLSSIRFRADGTGEGIIWEPVTESTAQRPPRD